ncbi:hypothetical protein GOV08_03940 [Candidatus Woesearchaeota archaeon]|nr:hypothetical protein [Candidatus Woesearchaeota archaeon]
MGIYGAIKKRCPHCSNVEKIITVDDAPTIFFKCSRCKKPVYLNDKQDVIVTNDIGDRT